ncbi:MAG: LPXTG cell wall anchor domain-containing protein [Subdoligranulum variabile]|nr:LPXTG cell wall anchor domain-containing protein [Subdoligranulum variabile]
MNNTQKRTLRRIILEAALLLLLLPAHARADAYQCTATLPVEVRTAGAATAERFTITLTPEDGAPAPAADTVQIQGSGTASFTRLVYTAPGDYRYTVCQRAGTTAQMTYDATVYTVTVRVTNQPGGGLGAEIWATGATSEKTGLLLFQNRYDPPAAPTPTPAPAKTTPVPAHPAPKHALPQTGDPMPVTLLAALAVLSAGGLMGLYYNKYGRKERK